MRTQHPVEIIDDLTILIKSSNKNNIPIMCDSTRDYDRLTYSARRLRMNGPPRVLSSEAYDTVLSIHSDCRKTAMIQFLRSYIDSDKVYIRGPSDITYYLVKL